jgi:PAS domain S-box-containing protein
LATKKIEEKNKKFKKIIDNAIEGIIIIDENLKITDVNKTAEKMFGYKLEEVKDKSLLDFVPKDEQEELKNNYEISQPVELIRKRKDGSKIVCLATRTFFTENNKKYRVSMVVDITKFKEQEQMLAQQSKSTALGEMIGNIAHQWRQPLNTLSLYISNLILDYELGELTDKKIEEFQKNTTKLIQGMSQTINDFTEFLKPDKEKKEFSLIEAINETLEFIEASYKVNNIKIEKNIKKDIKLFGIKSELEQVFLNILNNSKDAFKERNIKIRKVTITAEETKDKIIIAFKDNAGGVDEKIINRLTEPYFSTKFANQGTGLGLYMSEMVIKNSFNGQLILKNINDGLETKLILEKKLNL